MGYNMAGKFTSTRRSTRRRYTRRYARKRTRTTVRRKAPIRRLVSKRRILNVASKKKQDNMPAYAVNSDGTGGALGGVNFVALGVGNVTAFAWCATARDRVSNLGDNNATSVRSADLVYMRGLKERLTVMTDSQMSWRWRRITFTCKGPVGSLSSTAQETSNGWVRLMRPLTSANLGTLRDYLFRGATGLDNLSPMNAKVDTNRVTLKSDVTRVLSSGNDSGKFFRFNHWYPMNKNLLYSNDELGEGTTADAYSTLGRAGMGDYYVIDLFESVVADNASHLRIEPQATLYWHEK